jgi:hypothetical protein
MANTIALLELIPQFASAFADPENVPAQTEAPPKFAQESTSTQMTNADWCEHYLREIKDSPKLMAIAVKLLEELATIADLQNHLTKEPSGVVEVTFSTPSLYLPETHARQSTADCVHGNCPADH